MRAQRDTIARNARGMTGKRSDRPRARRLGVFSVDTTSVQIAWATLGPGPVRFRAADTTLEVVTDGGPGAIVLDHLPVDTQLDVRLDGRGVPGGTRRLDATTLTPPPGEELTRLATISDLHVGERAFGYLGGIREPAVPEPYTLRSATAAIAEANAWGAELLVVKGDITHKGRASEWRAVGPVLGGAPMPVLAVPGNHDVKAGADATAHAALTRYGIEVVQGVVARDLPGVRLVGVDTTVPDVHAGRVHHLAADLRDAAAGAASDGRGVLVAMHHQLQTRFVPARWPPGVPVRQSRRLLRALGDANPHTLVTSGHTHRHRRHTLGPVTTTTVGSVKDYPGVWAGYVVHEGGIRQIVRRVARADVIAWTERSGATMAGAYRWWTPGALDSRCFTLDWSS